MNESSNGIRVLRDQVAVVTGAARGLGLAIADELAVNGARVIMADLSDEEAETAAEALRKRGFDARANFIDIADSAVVERFFAQVQQVHGRLDILVNNAAAGQDVVPVVELSDEVWSRVVHVTLTGTFYCCRAAGRMMQRAERGVIVNISSVNGQNPAALVAGYNAAKAGVISLTRTLALELAAYGVRVNCVCPGPVYTEFNRRVMAQRCATLGISESQMIERVRGSIPLGRWGEPADIARVVAFLCGPASAWMTGEVLRVSGGLEGVSAAPPKRTAKH
jgi:NAD(P)-dependent dehydrogenase (short-subunit alcohol dehydrogenase family)